MAAIDNRSSIIEGQLCGVWSEYVEFKRSDNEDDDKEEGIKQEQIKKPGSDAMKLCKEDMSLFGFCPAWDDFYLVVCEICSCVVKPQALRSHIELRHGNSSMARSESREASAQHTKSSAFSKSNTLSPHLLPNKASGSHGVKSSSSGRASPYSHVKSSSHCHGNHSNSSVQSSHSKGLSGVTSCRSKAEKTKPASKGKKNHTMAPVVRVERMSPSLVKTASTNTNNPVPADKKELPSPQQPPPNSEAGTSTSVSGVGLASSNSPLASSLLTSANTSSSQNSTVPVSSGKMGEPISGTKKPCSKSKKVPKERKLLPCKDREYDPNKHCGVSVAETGKPCTRSLTCKTHSLSLRRAVVGRKKNFDELLADHRAAKEALVKAAKVQSAISSGSSSVPHCSNQSTSENQSSRHSSAVGSTSATSLKSSTKCATGSNKSSSTSGHVRSSGAALKYTKTQNKTNSSQSIPLNRQPVSNTDIKVETPTDDHSHRLIGEISQEQIAKKEETPDPQYITHHPRPAALCTFGLRQLGNGLFMLDRRWDLPRAAFRSAVSTERNSHPPPLKKLCVESRLPPVPEPVDPSDPYSFTCSENHSSGSSSAHLCRTPVTSSVKTVVSSPVDLVVTRPVTTKSLHDAEISHKLSQSKIANKVKPKEKVSEINRATLGNKKKHIPASVLNGANELITGSIPSISATSGAVTLSAVPSAQALPLSFPLTIGEHLGALSRLQVSTPLVASHNNLTLSQAINRNQGMTSLSGASPTSVGAKESNVVVTGLDMLNGELPATSALLHSVTVSSRPLLTTPSGGLAITLGATGLVSSVSHLSKASSLIDAELTNSGIFNTTGNTKTSSLVNSISGAHNSHILATAFATSGGSLCNSAKTKAKVRKTASIKSGTVTFSNANHISLSQVANVGTAVENLSMSSTHGTATGNYLNSISANSHSSPPTLPSPSTTPSPHLRSPTPPLKYVYHETSCNSNCCSCPSFSQDSASPQVPASSPLHNGLGPSPPPFFTPKGMSISGSVGGSYTFSVSPVSRTSTPSPGTDLSSPGSTGSGPKGKNSSRHTSHQKPPTTTGHSTFHLSMPPPLNFSALPITSNAASVTSRSGATHPVTYQQVFASQMLTSAQLNQFQLHATSKHNSKSISSPPGLTLATATLPLKLPLLAATGITSSVTSSPQQQPPLLLKNKDSRRTSVQLQGSPPFPT